MVQLDCKYCGYEIQAPKTWIVTNGRVFCGNCCKSFEVRLGEEKQEELSVSKDVQIETALEELEKEMDQAIDEYNFDGF